MQQGVDMSMVQWFASLGVGGVLAWGIFLVHRKDNITWRHELLELQKQTTELLSIYKGERESLLQIVQQNSATIAVNTDSVKALHRRLDRDDESLSWRGKP